MQHKKTAHNFAKRWAAALMKHIAGRKRRGGRVMTEEEREEQQLLKAFRSLDEKAKERVLEYAEFVYQDPRNRRGFIPFPRRSE